MSATAVLDVGKTNVKLALFEGRTVVWQRSTANRVLPGPPYPHADVDGIWAFFIAGLEEANRLHPIGALVVTTHGATIALVDEQGLVLPVPDYEFAGFEDIEPVYADLRPAFAESGSPALPQGLNWGRQLVYLQERHGAAFARARHILMYPQYWTWRLTGRAAGEVTSLGCHGDGWEVGRGRPSSLAERRGWAPLMPAPLPAWADVGPLRPELAKELGLGRGLRVLNGIHDSNASLLPHLLQDPVPFTVISTGTWIVILAAGASLDNLDPRRDILVNVDVLGRPLPTARFMGGREVAALLDGASPEADVEDLAAVLAAGVLALPSFAPAGGPYRERAGAMLGTLPDRPGARAALAALYAGLMTDDQITALGADRGPLAVEGSFAANPLYGSILAALRPGQPVRLGGDTAGTAFGASLLARWPAPLDAPEIRAVTPSSQAKALLGHRERWRQRLA